MNKGYRHLHFLLAGLILCAACRNSRPADDIKPAAATAATYKNVLYATDSVQQIMDVYLPANRSPQSTPVVILIHGGAWLRGDKADFDGLGLDSFFMSKGCAVVNMNYRLDTKYDYPAPIYDIGQAMDYIKQKAANWEINADRVCLLGRSSGSQLAMMYAYSSNKDGRVKAVIDAFGPADLTDSTVAYASLGADVAQLLGSYATQAQRWHDASPIFYTATAVPTVIYQGTADTVVYLKQSTMLRDSLLQHNIPCMFATWQGYPHGWAQDKWIEWRETTYAWVSQYLDK